MIKQITMVCALVLATTEIYAQSVNIRGVRVTGSGCNSTSASASITGDGQMLSVLFDNFKAEIGNGSENPQSIQLKKDCRLLIDVDVPFGYQYALVNTEYRGFAAIPASGHGYHRFSQVIPGVAVPPTMREAQLRGPRGDNYEVIVSQKPGREVYSTCNRPQQTIEILTELFVGYLKGSLDRSMVQINLDSVDTGVQSSFKLKWKACK
jgi:hypothetical protein